MLRRRKNVALFLRKVQSNLGNYSPISFYSVWTKLVETIITKSTKNNLVKCDMNRKSKRKTGWLGGKKNHSSPVHWNTLSMLMQQSMKVKGKIFIRTFKWLSINSSTKKKKKIKQLLDKMQEHPFTCSFHPIPCSEFPPRHTKPSTTESSSGGLSG